jgi:hypothetical protein
MMIGETASPDLDTIKIDGVRCWGKLAFGERRAGVMLYLAVSAGYLAAVIVATIFAAGVPRWLLAAWAAVAGVVLVLPFGGHVDTFSIECDGRVPPFEPGVHCHRVGDVTQTMLGISVPYAYEIGLTASERIGVVIVAVAVLSSFLTPRYRIRRNERLAAPTAQPDS